MHDQHCAYELMRTQAGPAHPQDPRVKAGWHNRVYVGILPPRWGAAPPPAVYRPAVCRLLGAACCRPTRRAAAAVASAAALPAASCAVPPQLGASGPTTTTTTTTSKPPRRPVHLPCARQQPAPSGAARSRRAPARCAPPPPCTLQHIDERPHFLPAEAAQGGCAGVRRGGVGWRDGFGTR